MALDEKDMQILSALQKDSRQSLRQLAKTLKTSPVTVMKRIQRLEKEQVITGYTIAIDHDKLGYDFGIVVLLQIAQGKMLEIGKKMKNHPNIIAFYDITGSFDAMLIAKFKSRRSMDAFLKKMQTLELVERTKTSIILNTVTEKSISF